MDNCIPYALFEVVGTSKDWRMRRGEKIVLIELGLEGERKRDEKEDKEERKGICRR